MSFAKTVATRLENRIRVYLLKHVFCQLRRYQASFTALLMIYCGPHPPIVLQSLRIDPSITLPHAATAVVRFGYRNPSCT